MFFNFGLGAAEGEQAEVGSFIVLGVLGVVCARETSNLNFRTGSERLLLKVRIALPGLVVLGLGSWQEGGILH